MVVMFLPTTELAGVTHERIGAPSRWTVHAPHAEMPQPNFVPVRPMTSRSTQRSGMSVGTSTLCACPLMVSVITSPSLVKFGRVAADVARRLVMIDPELRVLLVQEARDFLHRRQGLRLVGIERRHPP